MSIDMDNNENMGWNLQNSYIGLPKKFYTRQEATPVSSPELVILNKALAKSLGLDVSNLESRQALDIFAGNRSPGGSMPIAQAYAGHQFGYFTMLGDGRALLLGEHITPRGQRFDIQLKGSGRTPYSRGGDGRAALGPMLREYIISETLYSLGVPTTRSLAVVTTGEEIIRETPLPGAILTRVAASHIRVGTFEYILEYGDVEELRQLADYTIERHFPGIIDHEDRYLALLREVIEGQARLISKWQLIGFIHGVMNTDNMTISGEAIDFGPCAFMDVYNPKTVFSSIDRNGRYAYENQPKIGAWNLARFAETLLPLLHEDEDMAIKIATEEISTYYDIYNSLWTEGVRAKLGLFGEDTEDLDIIEDLLKLMEDNEADFTNTFRGLTMGEFSEVELFVTPEFVQWRDRWELRLGRQRQSMEESKELMQNSNPAVIPRNHRVEEALEAAVERGDYSVMEKLLAVLSNPYAYSTAQDEYSKLPPPSTCPYKTFCGT